MVKFEYRKLRGKITEVYKSQILFAEKLGVSEVTVSNKLNQKTQFNQDDIITWCDALGIDLTDAGMYFFT